MSDEKVFLQSEIKNLQESHKDLKEGHKELKGLTKDINVSLQQLTISVTEMASSVTAHLEASNNERGQLSNLFERMNNTEIKMERLMTKMAMIQAFAGTLTLVTLGTLAKILFYTTTTGG
jgi:chromosome segregation ATPase